MLKRIGASIAHTTLSKDRFKDLQPATRNFADRSAEPSELDALPTSNTTQGFCKRCKKLDLSAMLRCDTKSPHIRLLEEFNDPHCQLCDIVQHFFKLHWGDETPSGVKGRRPRVYVQSKRWCSISDSSVSGSILRKYVYRIILSLDQRPAHLQISGQSIPYDDTGQFVLTELEINDARPKDNTLSHSVRRPIPPCIDLALVREWLNKCRDDHDICRNNRVSQRINAAQSLFCNGFRLIDVIDGRLVEITEPCEYVALSYVWGQSASFSLCTNKKNLSNLCQSSALYKPYNDSGVVKRLPMTIVDAISLCRSIGQIYLWVDSLCIVQDDLDEKRRLIHGMNSVYENADLTIVALSGVHADAGIAGISSRDAGIDNYGREYILHEGHGICSIGVGRVSLVEHIRSSCWNTRGWTYQEQLLSPRKLYFTPGEVFYECDCQQLREGYAFESLSDLEVRCGAPWLGSDRDWGLMTYAEPMNTLGQMINADSQRSYDVQSLDAKFQRIVSLYTRRQLKDPGDVLHALNGVYNRFYARLDTHGVDIDVLQGIPMRCISRALLWFAPKSCHTKRSNVSGMKPSTWSWTSWITPVDFACESYSNFPSSARRVFHNGTYAFSLVEEWCLTFEKGGTVMKARFPGRKFYDKVETNLCPNEIGVTEFLNILPTAGRGDSGAILARPIPGLLDFCALYIPVPNTKVSLRWTQRLGREWHLRFAGIRVPDTASDLTVLDCTVIALLDCDNATLDAFVLLIYDSNFMGICVKKAEGYFERVGICIFTTSKLHWIRITKKGLLEMYWKRILLR